MRRILEKTILIWLVVMISSCGGGGGSASSQSSNSNSSSNDDYAIDESLNFLTIANNTNAKQSQKDAVEYIKTYIVQGDNTNEEIYVALQEMDSLELTGWGIYDFNVLNGLSNLETITFYEYNDTERNSKSLPSELNLNRLSHLVNLKKLSFVNCDHSEIKNISDLSALEVLTVDSSTMKHGISFVSGAKVKEIYLKSGSAIEEVNLSALATLSNLENLEFSYFSISAFSDLSSLTKLKKIRLFNSNCDSFLSLGTLNSLEELDYTSSGTTLSSTNLLPIAPNLKIISISRQIDDDMTIGNLSAYTKLEEIYLAGVNSPTLDFTNWPASLKTISVTYGNIAEIVNMSHLVNLEELNLGSNELTEVDAIEDLPNLQRLYVIGNDIQTFPDLVLSLAEFMH